MADRIDVSRTIPSDAASIFRVLSDPAGHVAIDASGMLMDATGGPVTGVGDSFVVHMDREALGDMPLGLYDVTVTITTFRPDEEIAWGIGMNDRSIGHLYGYRLEPVDDGTLVTSYYDWTAVPDKVRQRVTFPVVPEVSLRATLGILARTVPHWSTSPT